MANETTEQATKPDAIPYVEEITVLGDPCRRRVKTSGNIILPAPFIRETAQWYFNKLVQMSLDGAAIQAATLSTHISEGRLVLNFEPNTCQCTLYTKGGIILSYAPIPMERKQEVAPHVD